MKPPDFNSRESYFMLKMFITEQLAVLMVKLRSKVTFSLFEGLRVALNLEPIPSSSN